jgi:hypothetical protein
MSILINILLPVFLVAGVSAIAERKLRLDVQSFSKAAFYVFSPAMVLDALVSSDVSGSEYGQLALAMAATTLIMWGLGEVIGRMLRLRAETQASFLIAMLLANTGNYGLPVNFFAFGDAGLVRAALLVTVMSLLRSTLGVYLAARGQATSLRGSLRQVFSVPVIYAAAIGLVVNMTGLTLPEPVLKAAHILGQGLVPSSLVVLGTQILSTLQTKQQSSDLVPLIMASAGRLVLAPVIAYTLGGLVGLNPLSRSVLTLQSATPSAVMTLVLATEFKTDIPFAALAILITTMASLLTVTLWLGWLV